MQNHVPTQLNYFALCQGNTLSLYSFLKMIDTQSSTINTVEIPCVPGTTACFFAFLTPTTANTELAKFKKHLSPNEVSLHIHNIISYYIYTIYTLLCILYIHYYAYFIYTIMNTIYTLLCILYRLLCIFYIYYYEHYIYTTMHTIYTIMHIIYILL